MKKTKRYLALMTASFLAITPMAATGLTAVAESHTLTITDTETAEHTYTAYPIIVGTKNSDNSLTNPSWGTGINSTNLITALESNKTALGISFPGSAYVESVFTPAKVSINDVAEILAGITDADKIEKLAKILNNSSVLGTNSGTSLTKSGDNYTATVDDGWYLVVDSSTLDNTDGPKVRSANLLQIVGNVTVNAKHSLPTLEKKIVEGDSRVDANTAAIGDTVSYEIKTKVPDMTGYNRYFFIVEDNLSQGLTYNGDISVKVVDKDDTTNTTTLTKDADTDYTNYATDGADYYVTTSGSNPTNIKIVFEDVLNNFGAYDVGDDIVIAYTATLNTNASINPTEGNPNSAKLKYSNDPNTSYDGTPATTPDEPDGDDVMGETPWDKVNTYTTAIKIKKVDQDGQPLKGATFTLKGVNLNQVNKVSGSTFTQDDSGSYWKLKNGSYTTTIPTAENQDKYESTTVKYKKTLAPASTQTATGSPLSVSATVDDDGYLTFSGLNAGTYTLEETGVPSGYNKAEDITFTLAAEVKNENAATWSNSNNKFGSIDAEYMFPVEIENRKGSILPSTGGIGTKLFYLFGGLLVAGSVVFLVTKRRMNTREN